MKRKRLSIIIAFTIIFLSCNNEYTTVEMIQQEKKTLSAASYIIETTNGSVELKLKKKQRIFPVEGIRQIYSISSRYPSRPGYEVGHEFYYSKSERRVVIYIFLIKENVQMIESMDTVLSVKPFNNFNGIYTENFVYDNNKYKVISLEPEIIIGHLVEDFDYENLKDTGISQYKLLGPYEETDNEIDGRYVRTYYSNYIFPEENNELYIKYY